MSENIMQSRDKANTIYLVLQCINLGYKTLENIQTQAQTYHITVDISTICPQLGRLSKDGHLTIRKVKGQQIYTMTAEGKKLLADLHQHYQNRYEIFNQISMSGQTAHQTKRPILSAHSNVSITRK